MGWLLGSRFDYRRDRVPTFSLLRARRGVTAVLAPGCADAERFVDALRPAQVLASPDGASEAPDAGLLSEDARAWFELALDAGLAHVLVCAPFGSATDACHTGLEHGADARAWLEAQRVAMRGDLWLAPRLAQRGARVHLLALEQRCGHVFLLDERTSRARLLDREALGAFVRLLDGSGPPPPSAYARRASIALRRR